MKEIGTGARKWEGEKWFSELSDKRILLKFNTFLDNSVTRQLLLLSAVMQ